MPNEDLPFLDDVVDGERVLTSPYAIRNSSLRVVITEGHEIRVTNSNGELLPGVSLGVNDYMVGKPATAESAHEVAEWLRTNTREVEA